MKFAKYQQNNLVPEWRAKYLDVHLNTIPDADVDSTRRERNCSKKSKRLDGVNFLGPPLHPLHKHQMEMTPTVKTQQVSPAPQVTAQSARIKALFDNGLPFLQDQRIPLLRRIPANLLL
jgi:hypothetical protein